MKVAGTLVKWNEARGFGFIRTAAGDEVFVHASAFPPDPRRPELGESLLFDIHTAADGRLRASDVQRPGRTVRRRDATARRPSRPSRRVVLTEIAALAALIAIGAVLWMQRPVPELAPPAPAPAPAPLPLRSAPVVAAPPAFRCDARRHCSQMTSCAEAEYFLANCSGVEMDGDHDGSPCEDQWCR